MTRIVLAVFLCAAASAEIGRDNVKRLRQAWIYRTGEPTTAVPGGGRPPAFEPTPIHIDGTLYIGTPFGRIIALDPRTGKAKWTYDAKIDRSGNYGDFANRGVAAWLDARADAGSPCRRRIYLASIDARLHAVDGATGKPCADFGLRGQVDLKTGLRRGPSYVGEYQNTSPPAVIGDLVVVGSAIADNNRLDAPSGEVRAFDARTGVLRWSFDPLPGNPNAGGANAWSLITVDPERRLIFVPTGSASPDYFGGLRPGDNRYANSVVALRAETGEVAWHFQTVHHDLWDYDVASPPLLFTSRGVPAVAAGSKTGHLFLLNRTTGEPLFPVQERAVPKSDVPGEEAAPTQPFPSLPGPLVPQTLTAEQAWGPTEKDRESCREQIAALRNEGIFTPPSLRGSLIVPGNVGGLHWGGAAFDSATGMIVTPTNRMAAVVMLLPGDQRDARRKSHPDWETTGQRGTPFAMSRKFLRSPSGLPCNPPPFGALTGVDANTGRVAWEVPLGKMPGPGARAEWGAVNLGGPLAANGVVFIGASFDPAIRAFDAATGELLWQAALPASARSTPMTFTSGGKQYVAIAAGGHSPQFGPLDNALVVFALP